MKSKNLKDKYEKVMHEIKEFEKSLNILNDSEIRVANFNLQKQYFKTQVLDNLISKSFAITREASLRTLGLRHYDVQLLAGLVLNDGKIAEMKTGEGKTLVATLPASLNGITKKGVHIVTVNDYLATRDYLTMNKIYKFIGLKAGLIQNEMSTKERIINYKYDITYITNSELTFDYLRDSTAFNSSDLVLPTEYHYCIIDEVDSVLIDEAQTPVILANTKLSSVKPYILASEITNYLELNIHYKVNEKDKNLFLTDKGHKQVEKILGVNSLYNANHPWISYIINALKATSFFFNNVHYIIQKNRILIVDEFTGRTMPDRRWGDGLHQAIEAKEKLPISLQTQTQASITYQNYFLLYEKLSGMTGTGKTAEIEFQKIYNLSVDVIPTFRQNKRYDFPDLMYKDQFSKWDAIAKFCKKLNKKGQPVLVGTTSVAKSEMLSQLLEEYDISHQLLNARSENIKKEATIIAQAGTYKTVTISTNMAGRGTDIILGGNLTVQTQKTIYNILLSITRLRAFPIRKNTILIYRFIKKLKGNSQKMLSFLETIQKDLNFLKISYLKIIKILQIESQDPTITTLFKKIIVLLSIKLETSRKKGQLQKTKIVKNLGGLYVLGSERNDSRRIDNQLRGRCGRQGDPGTSRFFLSVEDTLLRLFGDKRIQMTLTELTLDSPLESNLISNNLDLAQEQVEEKAFEQRKNLFKYDKIQIFYSLIMFVERLGILIGEPIYGRKKNYAYAEQILSEFSELFSKKLINFTRFNVIGEKVYGAHLKVKNIDTLNSIELQSYFYNEFWVNYQLRNSSCCLYGKASFERFETTLVLMNVNVSWQEWLENIKLIREAVGWRSFGGKTPLTEYFNETRSAFFKYKELLVCYNLIDLIEFPIF